MNPGVRVIHGRIYDSENGKTCHQALVKLRCLMSEVHQEVTTWQRGIKKELRREVHMKNCIAEATSAAQKPPPCQGYNPYSNHGLVYPSISTSRCYWSSTCWRLCFSL